VSQENVEAVRRFNSPHEGQDLVPAIRAGLERLGPYRDPLGFAKSPDRLP
jgi:hypothetical protein